MPKAKQKETQKLRKTNQFQTKHMELFCVTRYSRVRGLPRSVGTSLEV